MRFLQQTAWSTRFAESFGDVARRTAQPDAGGTWVGVGGVEICRWWCFPEGALSSWPGGTSPSAAQTRPRLDCFLGSCRVDSPERVLSTTGGIQSVLSRKQCPFCKLWFAQKVVFPKKVFQKRFSTTAGFPKIVPSPTVVFSNSKSGGGGCQSFPPQAVAGILFCGVSPTTAGLEPLG